MLRVPRPYLDRHHPRNLAVDSSIGAVCSVGTNAQFNKEHEQRRLLIEYGTAANPSTHGDSDKLWSLVLHVDTLPLLGDEPSF
jgi:hypothetical protein